MAITELETLLDKSYHRHPIPHPNRVLATWYCLTAGEDTQRCMFTELGSQLERSRIIFYIDRYKYSMRYALDRIARETRDRTWAQVPRPALQKYLKIAGQLMFAGIDYALASQISSALHTGTAVAFEDEKAWRVAIDEVRHDKAYGALELIGAAKRRTIDFATLVFYWIRNPSSIPRSALSIAQSVSRRGNLLAYTYTSDLAVVSGIW